MRRSTLRIAEIIGFVIKNAAEGFSVIIAPREKGTSISFNLPGTMVILGLAISVVALVAFVMLGVTYERLAFLSMQVRRLEGENEKLRRETAAIAEIKQEIEKIELIKKQIEVWAGFAEGRAEQLSVVRGATLQDIPVELSSWPRQYSYSILKEFYQGAYLGGQRMLEPVSGWISRTFIQNLGEGVSHPGIDIAAPTGTPVRCVLSGRVAFAGWDEIYGNLVIIDHGDSLMTIYGHNAKIMVKEGEKVERGQIIATVGNTGRSTAPHLHFGIVKNGEAVDPMSMISFGGKPQVQ